MIRRESTWGEIEKGDYILDKNEKAWRVVRRQDDGIIYIADREGNQGAIAGITDPAYPVTKLTPTQDEAIATVQKILGGTVLRETH